MQLPALSAAAAARAKGWVFDALRASAATRVASPDGSPVQIYSENALVLRMNELLAHPHDTGRSFCDELHAALTEPTLRAALAERHVITLGAGKVFASNAQLVTRRAADVAAKGLRACSLPSCAKLEVTVKQFQLCSACLSVAYCSKAHQTEAWQTGHRRACERMKAEREAETAVLGS